MTAMNTSPAEQLSAGRLTHLQRLNADPDRRTADDWAVTPLSLCDLMAKIDPYLLRQLWAGRGMIWT